MDIFTVPKTLRMERKHTRPLKPRKNLSQEIEANTGLIF